VTAAAAPFAQRGQRPARGTVEVTEMAVTGFMHEGDRVGREDLAVGAGGLRAVRAEGALYTSARP
jgi:hypothetical protein